MRPASRSILLASLWMICAWTCVAQQAAYVSPVPARITSAIDESRLVTLTGNVHPLARAEFDRGAVGDAQVLHRMLLLLQRSPEQEAALRQFLADQQDRSSANYRNWLSPEQFAQQFGPADADIQAVTAWLGAQGFTDISVGAGRTVMELTGTVAQVRGAFHTQIHEYAVNGKTRFANASDPQIPAALSPVIAGVVALNSFPVTSYVHRLGSFHKSKTTGEITPLFTFGGCQSGNCYGVGPADFATIYNTAPLLSGSPKIDGGGQGIAVVGDSNINVQDVIDFRTMFGLAQNFSTSNVILNGPDPGLTDDETEADLDVQWSGAVAPGARIDFVTSQSTEMTSGTHLSALYVVDHNLDAVMSESFGGCEQGLGTTLNQFYNALWEQAAAQGITVILSSGDGGSAGCDDFNNAMSATHGLAVSGFASTPFNVAVGGTDFDQIGKESQFWITTPTSTTLPVASSAKSYIPESTWNESCAAGGLTACKSGNLLDIVAGSGGVSTIYAKPSWQAGKGVPNDNHRDLPDVSLFASPGFNDSFYIICQADVTTFGSCNLSSFGSTFQGAGGTSASAPAFAGIMALVNQKQASVQNPAPRQGNANYFLYALAQKQNTANLACNSSSAPVAGCNFRDVTKGNNAVPCAGASSNCSSGVSGVNGVTVAPGALSTPAYTTTAGYDLATGLGTVNAQNLVNNWASVNTTATTTTLTLNGGTAVNITHGQSVSFNVAVSPASASGDVSLIATPSGGQQTGVGPFTLASGAVSGSTTALPGGSAYSVHAHYEGNGTDAPSDSAAVNVTVAREPSKVLVSVPTFDPSTGQETGNSPTTLVYGSPYILRADVTNASGTLSNLCAKQNCPTGTVVFTDTIGSVAQGAPNSGTFALNSAGYTEDQPVQFPGGTNVITATYSGDSSFAPPAQPTTYTLTVTPAPTQLSAVQLSPVNYALPSGTSLVGTPLTLSAFLITGLTFGGAPTGTIAFFDGATQLPGTAALTYRPGGSGLDASVIATQTVTFATPGIHAITAKFSGDPSYQNSVSAVLNENLLYPTTLSVSGTPQLVYYGGNVTLTATVSTTQKTPPITGQIAFSAGPSAVNTIAGTDANGNQILTATTTFAATSYVEVTAGYQGDSNCARTEGFYGINPIVPDFTITSNPPSVGITAGQQASVNVAIAPLTSMSTMVGLSCSTSPMMGVNCAITPASENLANSAPVSASLTITTDPLAAATKAVVFKKAAVSRKRTIAFPSLGNSGWWMLGGLTGALALVLILVPVRERRPYRVSAALSVCSVVLMALGCGGGSSSVGTGGGGGGGSQPGPSSIAVTLDTNKQAQGLPVNATAKITSSNSSNATTGTVTFWELNNDGALTPPLPVTNGMVQTPVNLSLIGVHQVYATYSGDANNKTSQSANTGVVITGMGVVEVTAITGPLTHTSDVTLTIQ